MNQLLNFTMTTPAWAFFSSVSPTSDRPQMTREQLRKQCEDDLDRYVGGRGQQNSPAPATPKHDS